MHLGDVCGFAARVARGGVRMNRMTRSRRRLGYRPAVAGLVIALIASACSGDGSDAPDTSQPAAAQVAADSSVAVVVPDEPSVDLSTLSFVDNLLAKETAGEWTREQGLVETLQVVAGEKTEAEILRQGELIDREATGIIAMARDYLEDGPDAATKTEIERLLNMVTFSGERLAAMAGLSPVASPAALVPLPSHRADAETDCGIFFREGVPGGVGACLKVRELYVLDVPGEGPYRVYGPADSFPDAGWQDTHYDLALGAMEAAVAMFSKLEGVREVAMTPVNLVFSVGADGYATADPAAGLECGIVLYTKLQSFTDTSFQQVIAHEMAHCFQTEAFVPQNKVRYEDIRWREEGLAEFLGQMVYPANNLEWDPKRMANLAKSELKTTLFERAYTNFMIFQYLHTEGGFPAIFGLVDSLPTTNGLQLQIDALSGLEGMFEAYQDFMETITDEQLEDSGGGYGRYEMTEQNRPTAEITSVGTVVAANIVPFGGLRRRLVVPEGKQACLTWDSANLIVEHRTQPDGEWAPLPTLFPITHEDPGTADLVVTGTGKSTLGLIAASVHDLDEEQDGTILGEWTVDNASIQRKVGYIAPAQRVSISGQIRVTFRDDGTVHMAYNGFSVYGSSEVVMSSGPYSTNQRTTFSSLTNASGTDGYEVKGDYVFYDSLSEGDFLDGSEVVTQTASGVFLGIRSGDIEVDITLPESSTETYPPSGWAILGAANKLAFACGGQIMLLDSVVLRRAG